MQIKTAGPLDAEALELLDEMEKALQANPLQGYKPHPKQAEFHAAQTKIKAFFGGNRSGKTVACIVDTLIQCVDRDCLPERLKPFKKWEPPFHAWVAAPKFEKHEDTILPMLRRFTPKTQLVGGAFDKSYQKQRRILEFANGSTMAFKTYDQDVDAFASAAIHRIHWDEEPDGEHGRQIRQEARARLISTAGDEIFGMTPLLGLSWVYDEIWEQRFTDGVFVVAASMMDNPWNPREEIEAFSRSLTKEERAARVEGRFVHFGGTFFDEFKDDVHVVPHVTHERIEDQDIVVGIDPGLRRSGIIWIAFDSDNAALVFDEFYPAESIVSEIAQEIKRRNIQWNCDPQYVIDPSARNRNAVNADAIEAAYAREGIYSQFGQNDRGAGILEMKRRLQQGTMVFTRECPTAIWEMQRYRRDPDNKDEFAAIKENDHLVDAIRYAVMSRAWVQPPPLRKKRTAYQQDFQVPYGEEAPLPVAAPLGPVS